MELEIEDFLPKYSDIKKSKNQLFNPYTDKNFYQSIYFKKEFYDEKVPRIESVPRGTGQLLKHQKIIARFLSSHTPYNELLLDHSMGCLHPDTPVLLYNGKTKKAKDVKTGDELIGDDGNKRKVLSLIHGVSDMYRVEQHKADSYIVNEDHILSLKVSGNFAIRWTEKTHTWIMDWFDKQALQLKCKTKSCGPKTGLSKEEGYEYMLQYRENIRELVKDDIIDISIKDYLKLSNTIKNRLKGFKPSEVVWNHQNIDLDPYILGMWLGNGNSHGDGFTSTDEELIEYWKSWAEDNNSVIKYGKKYQYYIRNKQRGLSPFKTLLEKYNLIDNKHIPSEYLINSRDIRLSLLAGIIDTDGYVYSNGTSIEIAQKNGVLGKQIQYLCRSLGYYCRTVIRKKYCIYKGERKQGDYTIISISGSNLEDIPTKIPRKRLNARNQVKDPLVTQISVTQVERGEYYGWKIDGNRRFLLGDFTVTHNSGKTCSAIGAIEQIKNEGTGFKGALILAPGKGLLDNFVQEIVLKCTPGEYIPENYTGIRGEQNRMHALRQAVKHFYKFRTYRTFAKDVESLIIKNIPEDDPNREEKMYKNIRDRYSNMIIVMDEVHHLRPKKGSNKEDKLAYQMMKLLARKTLNRKIILLSGTPMADSPAEIGSLMNIILPEDIPTGMDFMKRYMNLADDGAYYVKPNMANKLKNIFRGRVSVLKAMQSEVIKEYVGEKNFSDLRHTVVDPDKMSDFQSNSYKEAYELDTHGKTKKGEGYFHNSRQASLFVYPSGFYGNKGFKEYIIEKSSTRMVGGKKTVIRSYTLQNTFEKALRGHTDQDTINNIATYSSKYANVLKRVLNNQNKCTFIYCELVTGGGAILLSKLFELLGYSRAKGGESTEGKRYALLTGETATPNEINQIKNRFNQKDNMNGKYIQVIIGSSIVTEGFSLRNVQEEHIITPHWNYTPIDQALARGLRVGSHQDLIDAGITPVVRIYQHASIPILFPQLRSIDIILYKKSEIKDISIKQIERLMKESAFDCGLVYERNMVINGINGSRDCEYQDCQYTCDSISMTDIQRDIPNTELDYSTFQLYYSKDDIVKIVQTLENLFRTNFTLHLAKIVEYFPMYSGFELMSALRLIINRNTIIKNRYGFSSYLKEENNIYFLVSGLSDISSYFSSYYTRSPFILTNKDFSELVDEAWQASLPDIIQTLKTADVNRFDMFIKRLPVALQETYIEAAVLAKKQNTSENKTLQNNVLRYFKDFITVIDGVHVSTYLQIKVKGPLRCLINNDWSDCTADIQTKIQAQKDIQVNKLLNNPYGYYGIYDPENPDYFAIVRTDVTQTSDLRKKTTGQKCMSWKKRDIIPLAMKLKLEYNEKDKVFDGVNIDDRDSLIAAAKKSNGFMEVYKESNAYKKLTNDDLKRAYYWSKISLGNACPIIKDWFRKNNLLAIGKSGRKKKTDVPQK